MSTTGTFFNRRTERRGTYFKENEGADQLKPDPIAMAVTINRIKERGRARSTMNKTPKYMKTNTRILE